jgi:hypothetical protein
MEIVKIGFSTILQPNGIGKIIRETKKQIIVRVTERTFEDKSSKTFTHKFDEESIEWFSKFGVNQTKRFWKHNNLEVGGTAFIIK